MELQYYYMVSSHFGAYDLENKLLVLFYGKTLNELAKDIIKFYDSGLFKSTEMFNTAYGKHLEFRDPDFYTQCASSAFGIAPIIELKQKLNNGKVLTESDFKTINFELWHDASESVRFSRIPHDVRELRDILASTADSFGFYDVLPSDYEMCTSEEKLVKEFDRCMKNWIRKQRK